MAKTSTFKQIDAKRLLAAALSAGFETATVVIHPDGRIEVSASIADQQDSRPANTWDEVLRR
ncbi:hypothetical protein HHL25_14145 [Rhizobium sp. S-51]|uniref:Uncharacterized protein n=1 Tax=Rhizobium terricola TaxID=2728849 RepID=A0A7Y0FW87_9HYPH|nr:hypothetical protein [Rhizobium terricola]NML75268.1 hypothetical protein [Rhizobium terricola]